MLKIITSLLIISDFTAFTHAYNVEYDAISSHSLTKVTDQIDSEYYTTQIKCPEVNAGISDFIERGKAGQLRRSRAKFVNTNVSKVIIEVWKQGKGFEKTEVFDYEAALKTKDKVKFEKIVEKIIAVYNSYCGSTKKRDEAERFTKVNRDYLSDLDEGPDEIIYGDVRKLSSDTKKKFYPIGLRCPNGQNGQLVLMKANEEGLFTLFTYEYFGGRPKQITGMAADRAGQWELLHRSYPDFNYGSGKHGKKAAEFIKPVYENVCQSEQWKRNWFNMMKTYQNKFLSDPKNAPKFDKKLLDYE